MLLQHPPLRLVGIMEGSFAIRSISAGVSCNVRVRSVQRRKGCVSYQLLMISLMVTKWPVLATPKLSVTAIYPYVLQILSAKQRRELVMVKE